MYTPEFVKCPYCGNPAMHPGSALRPGESEHYLRGEFSGEVIPAECETCVMRYLIVLSFGKGSFYIGVAEDDMVGLDSSVYRRLNALITREAIQ